MGWQQRLNGNNAALRILSRQHQPRHRLAIIQATAGIIANRRKSTWMTKEGEQSANYYGSITQASTVQLGTDASGAAVYVPMKNLLPMVEPNDLVIGGWDISGVNYFVLFFSFRLRDL
jgi:hypothetical protein